MIDFTGWNTEELSFFNFIRRGVVMNKRNASRLASDNEELIEEMKVKIREAKSRVEKNQLYARIDGRRKMNKQFEPILINH